MRTHDSRVAALVYVTDADTGGSIDDPDRLEKVKRLLRHVLRGSSRDKKTARAAISARAAAPHAQRRLQQMMRADDGSGEACAAAADRNGAEVDSPVLHCCNRMCATLPDPFG